MTQVERPAGKIVPFLKIFKPVISTEQATVLCACVRWGLTILTGGRLDVNLVVVPSELLEKWMNEWNAGYEESCPRCRTDSSVCHQDIACSFRKPKIDDRPKCVANEREKPVIDQQRGVFVTISGPFEEYVVKEI